MRHGAARGRIAEYALGLLPPGDAFELEKHLGSCQACTLEADALEYAAAALATVAAVDPGLLHAANPVPAMPPGTTERVAELVAAALEMDADAVMPGTDDANNAPPDDPEPTSVAAPVTVAATAITQEWAPPHPITAPDETAVTAAGSSEPSSPIQRTLVPSA